ncbi:MAG: hypothetical protein ABGX61_06215 [Acidimicrobiales bacterium]|jgi:hypothetical protein
MPNQRGHFVECYNAMKWTGKPILGGYNTARSATKIETWSDDQIVEEALAVINTWQF